MTGPQKLCFVIWVMLQCFKRPQYVKKKKSVHVISLVGLCSNPPAYLQTSPGIWTQGSKNTSHAHKVISGERRRSTCTCMGIYLWPIVFDMWCFFIYPICVHISSSVCSRIHWTYNTTGLRGTRNMLALSIFKTVYFFTYFPYLVANSQHALKVCRVK